jgi:hypothetical protein
MEQNGKEKAGAKEAKPKKPLEYRRFERLLRRAVNTPPTKRVRPKDSD